MDVVHLGKHSPRFSGVKQSRGFYFRGWGYLTQQLADPLPSGRDPVFYDNIAAPTSAADDSHTELRSRFIALKWHMPAEIG
jgi:hypothetical protein